jgi:hypothetical protein
MVRNLGLRHGHVDGTLAKMVSLLPYNSQIFGL